MPITYAHFVAVTLGTMFGAPESPPSAPLEMSVRLGKNMPNKDGPGHGGVVSFELAGPQRLWFGTRPCAAIGVGDGVGYVTACLAKNIKLGPVTVTPSFGPTLFASGKGASELLQFRTSVDLAMQVQKSTKVGLGFYHISNAGISKRSAAMDVVYASIQFSF